MSKNQEHNKVYLYRIMPSKRVKQLFETGSMVLINPKKWNDPFETFIAKINFIEKSKRPKNIQYFKNVFGVCFSLGTESNLMWDAYSPKGDGIRIKIELSKLLRYIKQQNQLDRHKIKCRKVSYNRYKTFLKKYTNKNKMIKMFLNQNSLLVDLLFSKRKEYRDEREYRIIYDANNDGVKHSKVLPFKIPANELIEAIRFDPKMPDKQCEILKEYFIQQGMAPRQIQKSLLYKYMVKEKITL